MNSPTNDVKWEDPETKEDDTKEERIRKKAADPPGAKQTFVYHKKTSPSRKTQGRQSNDSQHEILIKPDRDTKRYASAHANLLRLESKRRSEATIRFNVLKDQWDIETEILQKGFDDVLAVERLITGLSKAGKQFASHLQAVSEDKLIDDQGNIAINPLNQLRLHQQRNNKGINTKKLQIFHSIFDNCQNIMHKHSKLVYENSDRLTKDILPKIYKLKNELSLFRKAIQGKAEKILKDCELSQNLLQQSFGKLEHKMLSSLISPAELMNFQSNDSFANGGGTNHNNGSNEDTWLIEVSYNHAVLSQKSLLSNAEKAFVGIQQEIASFEESRVNNLRSIVQFGHVQKQQKLLESLPHEGFQSALENLTDISVTSEGVEDLLSRYAHTSLKLSTSHRSSILNRSKVSSREEEEVIGLQYIEREFGSPLKSSTILMVKVMEIKSLGIGRIMRPSWKGALVVISKQGHFSAFQVSNMLISDKSKSYSPLEVFEAMQPTIENDTSSKTWRERKEALIGGFQPVFSRNLKYCDFVAGNVEGNEVEVIEEAGETKSKLLFSNSSSRVTNKCTLRLGSEDDAREFLSKLDFAKLLAKTIR